jgi:hypothetical protein
MSEISLLVHNLGQVGKALLHGSLSRVYVLFLDFEDLRTAADGIDQKTGNEADGDTSVVAADSEVYEIPALGHVVKREQDVSWTIMKILYRIVGIRRCGYRACMLLLTQMWKKSQTPVTAGRLLVHVRCGEEEGCIGGYRFVKNCRHPERRDRCESVLADPTMLLAWQGVWQWQ